MDSPSFSPLYKRKLQRQTNVRSPSLSKSKKSPLPGSPLVQYSDRFVPSRRGVSLNVGMSPQLPIAKNTYDMLLREVLEEDSAPRLAFRTDVLRSKNSPLKKLTTNKSTLTPVSAASSKHLRSPDQMRRKISKTPFKVLDAPSLQDDFYLNLLDWSSQNTLAVGLADSVYLWSAVTSKVTRLCALEHGDVVTSVSWTDRGASLAVGTEKGEVHVWDATSATCVRKLTGHTARVASLSWNSSDTLASGSRDRSILLRDPRSPEDSVQRLLAHRQEVCGLKWSFDDSQLASGGNDNKLLVWSAQRMDSGPLHRLTEHQAAVKAIAWSPHQSGLLASGGGTADRTIRFWNTLTGSPLEVVDTGSQVCNLMWSKTCNEIVSTHGYSLNQIIVWRYPTMDKLATLTGHTFRVLYLSGSPDGQTVVTGAGDETLRFWNVFPNSQDASGRFSASRFGGLDSLR